MQHNRHYDVAEISRVVESVLGPSAARDVLEAFVGPLCAHGFVADGQACGEFGCTEPAPVAADWPRGIPRCSCPLGCNSPINSADECDYHKAEQRPV